MRCWGVKTSAAVAVFLAGALSATAATPTTTPNNTDDFFNARTCRVGKDFDGQRCHLGRAQLAENQRAVERATAQLVALLGSRAGVASPADTFRPLLPNSAPLPQPGDVASAFNPFFATIAGRDWWSARPSGADAPFPLREPANVVTGVLAARAAGVDNGDQLLQLARNAGEYLLLAQRGGDHGLFPFPEPANKPGPLFDLARQGLASNPNPATALHNGWLVDDAGAGSLYFDNGLAGLAVLDLYEATGEGKWLAAARNAADWARRQPAVTNWNYNSFSVGFLARFAQLTGERPYLERAVQLAELGVLPGQLRSGPHTGRWLDPHNARSVYHWIMVRNLGLLLAALPEGHGATAEIRDTLIRALSVANNDIITKGIAATDGALEALALLQQILPAGTQLPDSGRQDALAAVARVVWGRFRAGAVPVQAGPWGRFLQVAPHV